MRLLLVEDDVELGRAIERALSRDGTQVDWLMDGALALRALASEKFEVVILDLTLPGIDGIEVLRRMRAENIAVPVLIMTARDTIDERVLGLDSGADDYVVKPVDLKELRSRINALSRRSHGIASSELRIGELTVNPSARQVAFQGRSVDLSRREFALLMEFVNHPERVLTREYLESVVYGWGEGVSSNALEVHIHHLRKKIEPGVFATVRGVGYKLVAGNDR